MKADMKDIEKFLSLSDKVANDICNNIYEAKVKDCKSEEERKQILEQIKNFKKDML